MDNVIYLDSFYEEKEWTDYLERIKKLLYLFNLPSEKDDVIDIILVMHHLKDNELDTYSQEILLSTMSIESFNYLISKDKIKRVTDILKTETYVLNS